jgi:tetratricopeptide (TPR) repeat protein
MTSRGSRGTPEAETSTIGLFHTVFLERGASDADASSESRLGQAAFLVLRLVDLLAPDGPAPAQDDLFRYQAAATARYCREEVAPGTESEHLLGLVHAATEARRRRHPGWMAPTMLAYAAALENAAKYDEALDVLQSLARVAGPTLDAAHGIAADLQIGRVLRECARFDEAATAYERAATLAAATGDQRSVLLSRLGRANVFWGRGNLAEAERWNREVLLESQATRDQDVEARAEHGLGIVLGARGQVPDALPHLCRAAEMYESPVLSHRALHDLGLALARLGVVDLAERALRHVFKKGTTLELRQHAAVELMYSASFRRDRIGFTRWRAECSKTKPHMTPRLLVDFQLKAGVGLARFAKLSDADAELKRAMSLAHAHGLHEFEFRIERILAGLRDCEMMDPAVLGTAVQPVTQDTGLLAVSGSLARLET